MAKYVTKHLEVDARQFDPNDLNQPAGVSRGDYTSGLRPDVNVTGGHIGFHFIANDDSWYPLDAGDWIIYASDGRTWVTTDADFRLDYQEP